MFCDDSYQFYIAALPILVYAIMTIHAFSSLGAAKIHICITSGSVHLGILVFFFSNCPFTNVYEEVRTLIIS